MFNIGNEENSINIKSIIKAVGVGIIITIILLFIYSIILTYTNISETTMPTVVIVITAISILIASQLTTKNLKKNGIINGGLVGLIYIVGIYIISSIITGNFGFNLSAVIMCIVGIMMGALGGIIGINMK